jgi:hypothetical protein
MPFYSPENSAQKADLFFELNDLCWHLLDVNASSSAFAFASTSTTRCRFL